jgi:hypothetical protein
VSHAIPEDAFEAAQALGTALEDAGVPYAIGGAIALGVHGVPRGTLDVDLNVFVDESRQERVFGVLRGAGVAFDDAAARAEARSRGMFVGYLGAIRIDVFVPSIPFSDEAGRTRIEREAEGTRLWFLSAEALSVFKLLFFRTKDIADLERLVAVAKSRLDVAYVRRWLVTMMGEDDERVARWDAIVRAFG